MSRESAKLCLPTTPHAVIARLDRAIQYSRDRNESSETPRRTGFPAGACHRARQRRDPVTGNDSARCRHRTARQSRNCEELATKLRSNFAQKRRSNPESLRGKTLDCFAALAMTMLIHGCVQSPLSCPRRSKASGTRIMDRDSASTSHRFPQQSLPAPLAPSAALVTKLSHSKTKPVTMSRTPRPRHLTAGREFRCAVHWCCCLRG